MICKKCGYENPYNVSKCAQCGEKMYTAAMLKQKRKKKEKLIVVLFLVIASLLVAAGGVFIYKQSNPRDTFHNIDSGGAFGKPGKNDIPEWNSANGEINEESFAGNNTNVINTDVSQETPPEEVVMCGFCGAGDHTAHPDSNKSFIYGKNNSNGNVVFLEFNGIVYAPFLELLKSVNLVGEESENQGVFSVYNAQISMGEAHKADFVATFDMNDCYIKKGEESLDMGNSPIQYGDTWYIDVNAFKQLDFEIVIESDSVKMTKLASSGNEPQQEQTPTQTPKPKPVQQIQKPKCSICGAEDHVDSGHPRCPVCNDINHLIHCSICDSRDHSDEGHPRCPVCNDTAHTKHCEICNQFTHNTSEHPRCPVCNDINHLIHCSICDSRDHSDEGHPKCPECGSTDHIVHIFVERDF